MSQLVRSEIYPIPAPVGGWNTKDPLVSMEEKYATYLENLVPTTKSVIRRKGSKKVNTIFSNKEVKGLFSYNATDGTSTIIATGNSTFVNAKTSADLVSTTAEEKPTITSDKWKADQFCNRMYFVNGLDQCCVYDGTNVKKAAYVPYDETTEEEVEGVIFSNVSHYRTRIYFVQSDSLSLWYGGLNYIQGHLTEYDISSLVTQGGRIVYAGASTNEVGTIDANLFCVITSTGEILVFSGYSPSSETWEIVGHFYVSPVLPTSKGDCYFNYGSDIHMITREGVISVSAVLNGVKDSLNEAKYKSLTDLISSEFSTEINASKALFGWQGCYSPSNNLILINIPKENLATHEIYYEQFVMQTISQGWCKFTGVNGERWVESDGALYFVTPTGTLYQYTGDYDYYDESNPSVETSVTARLETAYNALGVPTLNKKLGLIKPICKSIHFGTTALGVKMDYYTLLEATIPDIPGGKPARWNVGRWDLGAWGDEEVAMYVCSINGIGRTFSITFQTSQYFSSFEIYEFDVTFERGGFL